MTSSCYHRCVDPHSPGQVDEPQYRVNGDTDGSKKSAVTISRYQQFMTSEDEADTSSAHSSDAEEEAEEEEAPAEKSTSVSTVLPPVKDEAPVSSAPVTESVKVRTNILDYYLFECQ